MYVINIKYIKWEENNGSIENTRNIWHRFLSTYNKEKEIYLKVLGKISSIYISN